MEAKSQSKSDILFEGAVLTQIDKPFEAGTLRTPDGRFEMVGDSIIATAIDGDLNLTNLPPTPWTQEALGTPLYKLLCRVMSVGDLSRQRNPNIDPRSFGESRAKTIIRATRARGEDAQRLYAEGRAIQALLNAKLPPITGTPRKAGAPPLSPAKTERKRSKPSPVRRY